MATVILGGGIIGLSTAYYLSRSGHSTRDAPIKIIDSAPQLLAGASGNAGGFLASDWFSASVAPLGQLSFDLHEQLAREYNGRSRWNYGRSTALSLSVGDVGVSRTKPRKGKSTDWLSEGASRKEAADEALPQNDDEAPEDVLNPDGSPRWLKAEVGRIIDTISSQGACAQVEPMKLCEFLREESEANGVEILLNRRTEGVVLDMHGAVTGIKLIDTKTNDISIVPCSSIVIAAGPWTPFVFKTLYPKSALEIPIEHLAGHSCTVRSRHLKHLPNPFNTPIGTESKDESSPLHHAIFSSPSPEWPSFAPEAISRTGRDGVAEVYIAGLNSSTLPLPSMSTESKLDEKSRRQLRHTVAALTGEDEGTLDIVQEVVCFRPVMSHGVGPIIGEVSPKYCDKGASVYIASGHGPWGISLSLGTGLVVSEMVTGRSPSVPVDTLGRLLL